MKFHTDSPSYGSYCLSTEMFYVEIVVSDGNRAVDAKVHHIDGSQTSQSGQPSVQDCPEMVDCLNRADFKTFVKHLDGLQAIYDALKKTSAAAEKSRCWNTLSVVERDLETLHAGFNAGVDTRDPYRLVHCSALGLVRPRVGGLPLRITYFLTPSQLLLLRQQQSGGVSLTQMLTNNNGEKEDQGLSATVALEACQSPNLLPASSLVNRSNLTSRVPLSPRPLDRTQRVRI